MDVSTKQPRKRTSAKKPKPTRAEKLAAHQQALLKAAAEIVGERGYQDASVASISERAGMAYGTFYRYFESRQDLFDQLLPTIGGALVEELGERVSGARTLLELEEKGFRGFFDFIARNPGFYRILNEAEVAAPAAFQQHIDGLADHYIEALDRSRRNGELRGFDKRELEVLAFILMAARFYIYLRFAKTADGARAVPAWVIKTYMKFIAHGLTGDPGKAH